MSMTMREVKIGSIVDLHGRANNPIARLDNYPEAILKKVQFIIENNDIILFTGDVFNAYITNITFINQLLLLLVDAEAKGKIIKIIYGNHDIIGRAYDSYLQTALGTITIGRNWLLTKPVIIESIGIYPLLFKNNQPYIPDEDKIPDRGLKILVGHAYFEHPEYNDIWNIDSSFLMNYEFDYCILGHDHQQYPILEVDTCKVIRSGSISRGTIDEKDVNILYPQITAYIDEKQDKVIKHTVELLEVPHKPSDEVFKIEDTSIKDLDKHRKNVDRMIELLKVEQHKEDDKLSLTSVLKEIKCPKKYLDIIGEVLHG